MAAIEIKYSSAPVRSKGLKLSMEDLETKNGFIIKPGEESYPVSPTVKVVSLTEFLLRVLPAI